MGKLNLGNIKPNLKEYQKKQDNGLTTNSKEVVGAINENKKNIDLKLGKTEKASSSVTADKLSNARKINGIAFDGSQDITIESVANSTTATTCTGNSATATKLATARNINGVAFDGSKDITITQVENATNAKTATTCTGNSATATKLATARNINGVAFDGSQNITITKVANSDTSGSCTGNSATATKATTADSCTGNSATATKLATARQINGVAFDGSQNITITKVANATTSESCTGNSATATKLSTARKINGIAFDGSQDITIDVVKDALLRGSLPAKISDAKGLYDLLENNSGLSFDSNLLFLNDAGTKQKDKIYFDRNKKGMFKCIAQTTSTVNSTSNFVDISNQANSDKLENLLGFNQKYYNVLSEREVNVDYINNTGKPIVVYVTSPSGIDTGNVAGIVDGIEVITYNTPNVAFSKFNLSFIVPNNSVYRVGANYGKVDIGLWVELR